MNVKIEFLFHADCVIYEIPQNWMEQSKTSFVVKVGDRYAKTKTYVFINEQ